MKLSRFTVAGVLLISLVGTSLANADKSVGGTPSAPILPKEFGGWQISGAPHTSADPAAADPTNAAVLKEYGFIDFESSTYTADDGRKLTLKAARFADASGAYGAFTYYKTPSMLVEKIGDQAASLNERVLFYRGDILLDAVFQGLTAMSAAELRELAGESSSTFGQHAESTRAAGLFAHAILRKEHSQICGRPGGAAKRECARAAATRGLRFRR